MTTSTPRADSAQAPSVPGLAIAEASARMRDLRHISKHEKDPGRSDELGNEVFKTFCALVEQPVTTAEQAIALLRVFSDPEFVHLVFAFGEEHHAPARLAEVTAVLARELSARAEAAMS